PFDPYLPSKSLHAVQQGLEYWHRTIAWMAADTASPWSPSLASEMHDALVAQVAIWHSLITGRQDLTAFTAKSVTEKIMRDLMDDLEGAARAEIIAEGARQVEELAKSSERALEAVLGG